MGQIEVICGPMFSGKTEELIRRLKRAAIARRKVQVFKPRLDARYDPDAVVSHVAVWRGGTASAARDIGAVLRGARPDEPVEAPGTPAWQARVSALYNQMRLALKKGDWSAFGEAFESLGRLTGQPPIR